MKKLGMVAVLLAVAAFSGCARGGGDIFYRTWKHIEWHFLGFYKDFTELHREIDRYAFNLDERNPDRY